MQKHSSDAATEPGRVVMNGASGRWAGERLLKAMQEGRPISPAELRSLDSLRKDEWKVIDDALIAEGAMRLRLIADLQAAGLTIPVSGAMGKTLFEYEKISDVNDAITSLSGVDRTDDDQPDFTLDSTPLPITHKDWNFNLRHLVASRNRGEGLDVTQARVAGRKVAERLEYIAFNGGPTYGGKAIYGLVNHPDRNVVDFETNYEWTHASKTGAGIVTDVQNMQKALVNDRFYGPYKLYVPSLYAPELDKDYKATSDITVRDRILKLDGIQSITTCDQLPANNVVMFQASVDVMALLDGEPLQSVQWDIEGGFVIKFKAFAIQIPLVRSTSATKANTTYSVGGSATTKKCGVVHLSQLS